MIVRLVYLVVLLLVRVLGRKFFYANMLEVSNILKITQFWVLSIVQILASPDLRQKFLSYIKMKRH